MRFIFPFAAFCLFTGCSDATEPQQVSLIDGTPVQLEELIKGKPAILNFWAASCAFCKHELPWFDEISRVHTDVAVIGINMQEPQRTIESYWNDGGYGFSTLLDPQNELRRKYEVSIQPTTIFVDASGNVVDRKDGPLNLKELEEKVQQFRKTEDRHAEKIDYGHVQDVDPAIRISPVPSLLRNWYDGEVKHLLNLEDILSGGPGKDGIPALDSPEFTNANEASYLTDQDLGILLTIDGDTRFYPYKILNWHEIVNDTVGGEPVFITYCPLCATGVVYGRAISKGTVTFGVSGMLSQSNVLMYDRATDSLWNQVTGQAVVGPLTGEQLQFVRSDIVRFSTVKNSYPNAKILSTNTGFSREYDRDPYGGYEEKNSVMFPVRKVDDRLHMKELVYGIVVSGKAKAYTDAVIRRQGSIADAINGIPVRIDFVTATEEIRITNQQTGEAIPTLPSFWFAWVAQYPETDLMQ